VNRFFFFTLAACAIGCSQGVAADKNPVVLVDTSMGKIKIELYPDKAPITVKNFLDYVDDKFYDGTIFHRVMPNFMIQGGGFKPGLDEKDTKKPIKNESTNGLENQRGTIAMARTGVPDSATAQFFINVKYNDFLDKVKARDRVGYCVFGKVIDGMDVVDKIVEVQTVTRQEPKHNMPMQNVPDQDVMIKSVRLVDK